MKLGLGISYLGSKKQISDEIVKYILRNNPKCRYIYDLFGGGAISFCFLQKKAIKKVIYNELNTGVTELFKKIKKDGITDEFYQWIDRKTFDKYKNDNTWFGGLIKTCWSFGCNQKDYLYSKEIEEYKRNCHLVIINGVDKLQEITDFCIKFEKTKNIFRKNILKIPNDKSYYKKRLNLIRQLMELIKKSDIGSKSKQLTSIQHLERVQQLKKISNYINFEIYNKSYNEVEITTPINETIIYLDPPYENTQQYQDLICYRQLEDYISKSPYKIYLSSYEALKGTKECLSINYRCSMKNTNEKTVFEKLFCNQEETKDIFSLLY
jgi:site-specific DNA-adenine methylase